MIGAVCTFTALKETHVNSSGCSIAPKFTTLMTVARYVRRFFVNYSEGAQTAYLQLAHLRYTEENFNILYGFRSSARESIPAGAPQQSLLKFRFNNSKFKSTNYIYNLINVAATFKMIKNYCSTLKAIKISAALAAVTFLHACSHRLVGTWTVQRYETTTPGQQGVTLTNIGTIQFLKNGSGEKYLNYNVLGISRNDKVPFKWTWTDSKYITIDGEDSEFAKTWIIMTNKKKLQKWKSTDGTNNIQIIELIR